jgi:hypothetical protein
MLVLSVRLYVTEFNLKDFKAFPEPMRVMELIQARPSMSPSRTTNPCLTNVLQGCSLTLKGLRSPQLTDLMPLHSSPNWFYVKAQLIQKSYCGVISGIFASHIRI